MQIDTALQKWGYKNTRENRKKLTELCENHPEICSSLCPLEIKKKTKKPYLPDRRLRDHYLQIVRAVKDESHLYWQSIGISKEKLKECLSQLCEAKVIVYNKKGGKSSTENYTTTIISEEWMMKRRKQRYNFVIKVLEAAKPNVQISMNS